MNEAKEGSVPKELQTDAEKLQEKAICQVEGISLIHFFLTVCLWRVRMALRSTAGGNEWIMNEPCGWE